MPIPIHRGTRCGVAIVGALIAALAIATVARSGAHARAATTASADPARLGLDASSGLKTPGAAGYGPPLASALTVIRPFVAPSTPYSAGHRGVDLRATAGQVVTSASAGRVSFAGHVAGRGVLVITDAVGVSLEYEPVSPSVARGASVTLGQSIGLVSAGRIDCAQSCLHWGARRAGAYFDPMSLLAPLGEVHLLAWAASRSPSDPP